MKNRTLTRTRSDRSIYRRFIFILAGSVFFYSSVLSAANLYVRKGATGLNNGTSWTNAWNEMNQINWANVQPGDTVWLAGGSYTTGMNPRKSGAAGNLIYVKRVLASDPAATAAAGWQSSFDSQVIVAPTNQIPLFWNTKDQGSHSEFDGRVESGISFRLSDNYPADVYEGAVSFITGSGGQTNITLKNIDIAGPGGAADFPFNYYCSALCVRTWDGFGYPPISNLTLADCRLHGAPEIVAAWNVTNLTFNRCKLYDNRPSASTGMHGNVFEIYSIANLVFANCEVWNWQVEGFRIFSEDITLTMVGCIWHSPASSVARVVEPSSWVGAEWGPMIAYNNTFVDVPLFVFFDPGSYGGQYAYRAGSIARNNLFYNSDPGPDTTSLATAYNWRNGSIAGLGAGSINGSQDPFVNRTAKNFRIISTVGAGYPKDKGAALPSNYSTDADGNTRGADGAWDIGAYESQGPVPPDPTKHCVRAGAPAGGDGSDWNKAFGSLPATLLRGHTYYFADGTYSGYTFDDPVSGTQVITIKKAIAADHGTDMGWVSTYGDGQAVFDSFSVIDTGFLVLDGNGVEFGIKLQHLTDDGAKIFNIGGFGTFDRNGIELRYVEIAGPQSNTPGQPYPFKLYTDTLSGTTLCGQPSRIRNFVLSHCDIHGGAQLMQICNLSDAVVEYSKIHDNLAIYQPPPGTDIHANVAYLQDSHNLTWRYNEMYNWNQQGFYPEYQTTGEMRIYGNVFHDSSGGKALWFFENATFEKVYIYNNTFANVVNHAIWMDGANTVIQLGEIKNNLFYNAAGVTYDVLGHDYNWYSGTDKHSEVNGIAAGLVNPFASGSGNFVLNASLRGQALAAEYNRDMNGNIRGADGAWDIGAYEFQSAAPPPPPPPPPVLTPPSITQPPQNRSVAVGQTATFVVGASGSAPLSYQWKKAGTNISGATLASYTTPPVTLADNGAQFYSEVRNSVGYVNSSSATLTVTTVSPPNTSPTITNIFDQQTSENSPKIISFTVNDAETPPANLTLSANSSNNSLVPNSSFTFGGSGQNRNVIVTPQMNQTGQTTITITVQDENNAIISDTFMLTVNPVVVPPPNNGGNPPQQAGLIRTVFNPTKGESFSAGLLLPQGSGRIEIYDRTGHCIKTFEQANSSTEWDGRSQKGEIVAAGMYVVKFPNGKRKVVVVK